MKILTNSFFRYIRSLLMFFCICFVSLVQVTAHEEPLRENQLRIEIWAELDAFPGSFGDWKDADAELKNAQKIENESQLAQNAPVSENPALDDYDRQRLALYSFAINRAKQIAPFMLTGMIHGWSFDYVPYDKKRHVDEIFEWDEVHELDRKSNPISYKDPQPLDNRMVCWAFCDRTETQQLSYRRWSSVNLPRVQGTGRASVEKGFDGIKEATANAIKDAVRNYWRIYEKNKPKEIYGTVLLIGIPRVYVYEGQYVTDLEFFLETDKIVRYTYY